MMFFLNIHCKANIPPKAMYNFFIPSLFIDNFSDTILARMSCVTEVYSLATYLFLPCMFFQIYV